jgi:hypothetical protein
MKARPSKNLVEFAAGAAKKYNHLFRGHAHRKRYYTRSAVCADARKTPVKSFASPTEWVANEEEV